MTPITNIATYPLPGFTAIYDGKIVRLIATGDQQGSSPVEKFVDENGRIGWAPSSEFRVVDFAPTSKEALREVMKHFFKEVSFFHEAERG